MGCPITSGNPSPLTHEIDRTSRAIKPLFGLIADSMPILGFNRTPYFALNSIAGVTALFMIGALDEEKNTRGLRCSKGNQLEEKRQIQRDFLL